MHCVAAVVKYAHSFATSMDDPPPMPTTALASCSLARSMASIMIDSGGSGITASKTRTSYPAERNAVVAGEMSPDVWQNASVTIKTVACFGKPYGWRAEATSSAAPRRTRTLGTDVNANCVGLGGWEECRRHCCHKPTKADLPLSNDMRIGGMGSLSSFYPGNGWGQNRGVESVDLSPRLGLPDPGEGLARFQWWNRPVWHHDQGGLDCSPCAWLGGRLRLRWSNRPPWRARPFATSYSPFSSPSPPFSLARRSNASPPSPRAAPHHHHHARQRVAQGEARGDT